ncbi:MAG: S26 family signal peptidase [Brevinematia bacterium]
MEKRLDKKSLTARGIIVFLLMICSILLAKFLLGKVVVSYGKSVPHNVFLKSKEPFRLYDYVLVKTSEKDPFTKGRILTKKITCTEGMALKVVNLDYYCCNSPDSSFEKCVYLGKAKLFSKKGERVTPFNPCNSTNTCIYVIPEGAYFLSTEHPDSYDSRYLGFFGKEDIISKIVPLF